MISELNIYGVFFSGAFVTALLATALLLLARPLLLRAGFYKLVWHRHLVDVALFVILWAIVALVLPLAFAMGNSQ